MFDLFRSQAKATRYLLIVLLSLVALSMVVTLIPGFGSANYGAPNEQVLARIGDTEIDTRMVRQIVQQQVRNQQMPASMAEMMVPQIVNQVVGEVATAYQANRMGFKVSDQEVIQKIQILMPQLFQGGSFLGKEAYQAYLAQMGLTIPEFEQKIRQQVLLDKLQRLAFDGIVVSPAEVEAEYRKKGEKVRLEVVKFDPAAFRSDYKPSREEMEKYLKERQAMYQVPAMRAVSIVVADSKKLGEAIPIEEAAIRQAYDSQVDRFRVPEKFKVRHILIKAAENAPKAEKDKAKAKAEDLLKQIKGGKDFAELAKKFSEDTGTASKGGEIEFTREGVVKPFGDASANLKPKELSGVVETVYGYHIIQGMEKQPARIKPYDEVKEELLTELRQKQLFDRLPAIVETARAEILKAPDKAAEIAARHGLAIARMEQAGPNTDYALIGRNEELDASLSSMAKGGVTEPVQTKDNRMAFAVVHQVFDPRPATLADVEPMVKAAIIEQRARDMADAKAKAFEKKVREEKVDFAKAAKELNLKLLDTGEFDRSGQMKDVGHASMFGEQPFLLAVGQIHGLHRVGQQAYFLRVVSRTEGDLSKLASERASIVTTLKEKKLRERRELFEEGLIRTLKSEGKLQIYDDAIKRLAGTFRGA